MRQAAFTDLRNNAKLYFDYVEAGESVRVLRNGKPIADQYTKGALDAVRRHGLV